VCLKRDGFADLDKETQMRLLAAALNCVSQSDYRPRYASLDDLLQRILAGGTGVLHGGQVSSRGDAIYIYRELKAVQNLKIGLDGVVEWDARFVISTNKIKGVHVAPLGEDGYAQVSPKPKTGLPLGLLLSFPSLWQDGKLIACAPLNFGPAYDVRVKPNVQNFALSLVTH